MAKTISLNYKSAANPVKTE